MAHYAFLKDSVVVRVITGREETDPCPDGFDSWEEYYGANAGLECKRTSYNMRGGVHREGGEPFRFNYAGSGYRYDSERDAFIPPQPYDSWILNEDTCLWEPPTPRPVEGDWEWDESAVAWVEVVEPSS